MKKFSYGERDYSFGQLMLTLRTNIGLTQTGVGDLLGVSRRAVAEWEMGNSYPTVDHLKHFIVLSVKQQAFAAGREAAEISSLWKAAHQKVLLDELWLQGLLLDRLAFWHEARGEWQQAYATLTRWQTLDPLAEEASQRLMRIHLMRGETSIALQIYFTLQRRLAEDLQVEPSAETTALAEQILALTAQGGGGPADHPTGTTVELPQPDELLVPFVGRDAVFRQLTERFHQVQCAHPQAVLVVGEAGSGKTRLSQEFVGWARTQGATVLSGQAIEISGRLPYHPLVEALRDHLELEIEPEALPEDLWLAELSRLLPELRLRYPGLPTPTEDKSTAKIRLFEAIARLFDALARSAPLVLLLEDLQWVDKVSLDLLRYLGRYWIRHGCRIMLLSTLRHEGLAPMSQLAIQLAGLGRDLPISQVTLQTLSQAETICLVAALLGRGKHAIRNGSEMRE